MEVELTEKEKENKELIGELDEISSCCNYWENEHKKSIEIITKLFEDVSS